MSRWEKLLQVASDFNKLKNPRRPALKLRASDYYTLYLTRSEAVGHEPWLSAWEGPK